MFNSILRYIMMTFISISVGCARQLRRVIEGIVEVDSYESLLAIAVLIFQLVIIFLLTQLVVQNENKLATKNFKQKYGTLYTPCEVDRGRWPLIFITQFCLRRWIVAMSVGLMIEQPLLQLTII